MSVPTTNTEIPEEDIKRKNLYFHALFLTLSTIKKKKFLALLVTSAALLLVIYLGSLSLLLLIMFYQGPQDEREIEAAKYILLKALQAVPYVITILAVLLQTPIANKVEAGEYPEYISPKLKRRWYEGNYEVVRFALYLISLNILICILYPLSPLLYYLVYFFVNSFLVGREFFENAASRHIGRKYARELFRDNQADVILCGLTIIILANIPFANFAAPFVGVTLALHLYHQTNRKWLEEKYPDLHAITTKIAELKPADFEKRYPVRNAHVVNKKRK